MTLWLLQLTRCSSFVQLLPSTCLQEMVPRLSRFTSELDMENTFGRSSTLLMQRYCYRSIGARFTKWLDQTKDPLRTELQTVRDAAEFARRLEEELYEAGGDVPFHVRTYSRALVSALAQQHPRLIRIAQVQ
jgi:hypothetical protein